MKKSWVGLTVCAVVVASVLVYAVPERAMNALVVNTDLTVVDTEYCYTATGDVRSLDVQARQGQDIKMAFVTSGSGTTYFTIKSGTTYYADSIQMVSGQVVCWQTAAGAGTDVEMIIWR